MTLSDFIHKLFEVQMNIKLYHWSTALYSRHKVADALVDKIQEQGDKFVEVFVGKVGREKCFPIKNTTIHTQNLDDKSVCKYLDEYIKILTYDVPKYIKKSDTDLYNIRDELLASVNQTKYLFMLS
jgi:hypothetical protein